MRSRARSMYAGAGLALVLVVGSVGVRAVWSQGSEPGMQTQDGQAMRAARLTFVQGGVTVQGAGLGSSEQAQLNMPLLAGVTLSTGADGEAEVEFEDGSLVRLTPNSSLSLDQLGVEGQGVSTTTVTVGSGLVYAELRAADEYRYRLQAGEDVLTPVENVTVRVGFDQPPATFAVLSGTAQVEDTNGGGAREVGAGETLRADASQPGAYTVSYGLGDESWDAWNSDRDQAEAAQAADRTDVRNQYAGQQGYGWSDLDANGTWYDVPGQGEVWQPSVATETAGWDPYGFGIWTWYPVTGYVWSSGYPWGWTPYRCGAWSFYGGFGWGWSPAGCGGGLGWAFWRAGRPVNIVGAPGWYRVPHVPHRPPGPVHPIVPGKGIPGRGEPSAAVASGPGVAAPNAALAGTTGWGTALQRGPRQINGMLARPVPRGDQATLNAGLPMRSGLDRDFPVDRSSHVAVTGKLATRPGFVRTPSGWQREGTTSYSGQSGAPVFRSQQRPAIPTAPGAVAPSAPVRPGGVVGQRPAYQAPQGQPAGSAPQPRPGFVPGQVNRPGYTSPGVRPSNTPPPQIQRPMYSPPVQRPGLSAPPPTSMAPPRPMAPPPMIRPAAPPPAPPPAPRAAPAPPSSPAPPGPRGR